MVKDKMHIAFPLHTFLF